MIDENTYTILIKGGTVLTGGEEFLSDVVVRAGRISYVGPDGESGLRGDPVHVIDAAGKYVSPGFIDLHAHGGAGADFSD